MRTFKDNGKVLGDQPKTEVVPRAKRRRFTAAYKQRSVADADVCTERGETGALLQWEGLYSSYLAQAA